MDSMLRHDKARLEALMAPGFVLHTAHPDYPETSRERWLDNLFNHRRIDEWEQTNISAHTYGDVGVVTSAYRWTIGRASCRERVGQLVLIPVGAVALKKKKQT